MRGLGGRNVLVPGQNQRTVEGQIYQSCSWGNQNDVNCYFCVSSILWQFKLRLPCGHVVAPQLLKQPSGSGAYMHLKSLTHLNMGPLISWLLYIFSWEMQGIVLCSCINELMENYGSLGMFSASASSELSTEFLLLLTLTAKT